MLRWFTIIGRLRGVRATPFRVRMISQEQVTEASWIAQNAPTPVRALDLTAAILEPSKIGNIVVLSRELMESWAPGSEAAIRGAMVRGMVAGLDRVFIDPTATL